MSKKPEGSGRWQRVILDRLDEKPYFVLLPSGVHSKAQRAVSKAAKSLVDQGKIRTFKAWLAGETGRRLKTFIARVDDAEADAFVAEHAVELAEIGGERVYEGSRRHWELSAEMFVQAVDVTGLE